MALQMAQVAQCPRVSSLFLLSKKRAILQIANAEFLLNQLLLLKTCGRWIRLVGMTSQAVQVALCPIISSLFLLSKERAILQIANEEFLLNQHVLLRTCGKWTLLLGMASRKIQVVPQGPTRIASLFLTFPHGL
jgi:hypothetical protein